MGVLRVCLYVAVLLACSAGSFLWGSSRERTKGDRDVDIVIGQATWMLAKKDSLIERMTQEILRLRSMVDFHERRNKI